MLETLTQTDGGPYSFEGIGADGDSHARERGGRERGREKPESFEEKKLEGGREREMDGWITGGMEGGSGGQHVGQGRISLLRIFTVLALNTIQRAEVDGGRGSDSRNLAAEN